MEVLRYDGALARSGSAFLWKMYERRVTIGIGIPAGSTVTDESLFKVAFIAPREESRVPSDAPQERERWASVRSCRRCGKRLRFVQFTVLHHFIWNRHADCFASTVVPFSGARLTSRGAMKATFFDSRSIMLKEASDE